MSDEVLERLRHLNQQISIYKQHVSEDPKELHKRVPLLEKKMQSLMPCYVAVNSKKIAATENLEALLELEETYEKIYLLANKDPVRELTKLLQKKYELMKTLVRRPSL